MILKHRHPMKSKSTIAWCLYDWAAASFSIIVTTFIFATYFTTKIAANKIVGTYQWANAMSLAGVIIAMTSPLFGAVADYGGHHKRWLMFFTLICILFTALLWFAYPSTNYVYSTLFCVVVATVGYEVALVFYNAYLPHVAPQSYLGRISGWGWSAGYFGGILALAIALVFFVRGKADWLDASTAAQVRICGPFVAVWYFVFALPLFVCTPNMDSQSMPLHKAVKLGFRDLMRTLRKLPSQKNMFLYLISHMIYTDGLNTLFAFGGIYAAGTFGLSFEEIILLGMTMNIAAGLGAFGLSWMDDFFGSKETVMLSLFFLTFLGIPLLFVHSKLVFWVLAAVLCIFVGPVQSASRSLLVRLIISKDSSTEMFGLYAFSGKITAFIGPWFLGLLTLQFSSQRVGMGVILAFFLIGAFLLLPVEAKREQ